MGAPRIVAAEPRYRPDVFDEMWNLDGLAWVDVPPPAQAGHRHVAQTVGSLGLDEIWRCPCGAITRRGGDGWMYVSPRDRRFAVEDETTRRVRALIRLWRVALAAVVIVPFLVLVLVLALR